jgi:hypothetical protein
MQKRLAEGKHGMGSPRDPKPQSQTPLGCAVIAGEEDDVTAHARSVHALKYEGRSAAERSDGKEEREEE